jgi:hypothetical protein
MGTNALAMKSVTAIPGNEWDILIGTGGDDQMLSVHFLSFSLHSIPNEQVKRFIYFFDRILSELTGNCSIRSHPDREDEQ